MNRIVRTTGPLLLALAMLSVAGVVRAEEGTHALVGDARATVDRFEKVDPQMARLLKSSVAYVVIPRVKKGAFVFGGAGGEGVLFEGGRAMGTVKLTQVTVGAQVGGQTYAEILFLQDDLALRNLKRNNLQLSAQASAVAAANGAAANANYQNGVAIFTLAESGLMAEASVGGQKFDYRPFYREPGT